MSAHHIDYKICLIVATVKSLAPDAILTRSADLGHEKSR